MSQQYEMQWEARIDLQMPKYWVAYAMQEGETLRLAGYESEDEVKELMNAYSRGEAIQLPLRMYPPMKEEVRPVCLIRLEMVESLRQVPKPAIPLDIDGTENKRRCPKCGHTVHIESPNGLMLMCGICCEVWPK